MKKIFYIFALLMLFMSNNAMSQISIFPNNIDSVFIVSCKGDTVLVNEDSTFVFSKKFTKNIVSENTHLRERIENNKKIVKELRELRKDLSKLKRSNNIKQDKITSIKGLLDDSGKVIKQVEEENKRISDLNVTFSNQISELQEQNRILRSKVNRNRFKTFINILTPTFIKKQKIKKKWK